MKMVKLYSGNHQWILCGRDVHKTAQIIDTNQYIFRTRNRCLLIDPGGTELFSPMLVAALHWAPIEEITDLFASHQDPDVISSLGLWDKTLPKATLHAPKLWEGFLRHFGCESIEYNGIPDEGKILNFEGSELHIIPAIICIRRLILIYMTQKQSF